MARHPADAGDGSRSGLVRAAPGMPCAAPGCLAAGAEGRCLAAGACGWGGGGREPALILPAGADWDRQRRAAL